MENFIDKIDFIKRLINRDSHNEAEFYILKMLNESEDYFIKELVNSDRFTNEIILAIKPTTKFIIDFYKIILEKRILLKNGAVDKAITHLSNCNVTSSMEEATTILKIIYAMISVMFESNKFQGISLIEKHAENLMIFLGRKTFEADSVLTVTKLYNLVIKYSEKKFKNSYFQYIQDIYFKAVNRLLEVKNDSLLERIRIACCISVSIVNMCCEIEVIDQELEKKICTRIQEIAMKDVIPILKNSQIDIVSSEDFILFLKTAINLKSYESKELCYNLVKNEYLTFLIKLSVFEPDRPIFRKQVCKVISKIIASLQNYFEFPLSDWNEGTISFQKFLCTGFETLPVDSSKWKDTLKISSQTSNSLLVLVYCHFLFTEEEYIFTKKSLALNLTDLDGNIEKVFIKILWLLYSVSSVTSVSLDSSFKPRLYTRATNKLVTILQKHNDIECCYTHHKGLLSLIGDVSIPDDIKMHIVRLWIDKSKTEEEFKILIKQFLDQGDNNLKIVKILMYLVHQNSLTNLNNTLRVYRALLESVRLMSREVVEFILKTLLDDLNNYSPDNSEVLYVVLMFVCNLPSLSHLSADVLRHCAEGLRNMSLKEDIDLTLKTQIISTCVFIIQHSVDENDSKIGRIFLENKEFLTKVYKCGFESEDFKLTQVSIYTLSGLFLSYEKFALQNESVMQVKLKHLVHVFEKIQKFNESLIFIIKFINLLLLNNRLRIPMITLLETKKAVDLKNIFHIYNKIHAIGNEVDFGKESEIYKCLKTILYHCYFQELDISFLLNCEATPTLFKFAIDKILYLNQPNDDFLDFGMTWLQQLWSARIRNKYKLDPSAEKSVSFLIELVPILKKLKYVNLLLIEDFCAVVNNYSKIDKELL